MARPAGWEPVWQGNGEAQAQIVADGLASRGIRARTQGARQAGGGLPHAFQLNTWAVVVPVKQAAQARSVLRSLGEEAGIVHGGGQSAADRRATLGFFALVVVGCVLLTILAALREAL